MHLDRWTLLLQTVNFIVLIWLLHRFLYQPVLRLSDARRAQIQRQFAEAHTLGEQAKSQLADVQAQRAGIAAEREAALKAASVQAEQAAAQRAAQARHEAQAILAQARETLAAEREQAVRDAHGLALELGAQVGLRLLQELPAGLRDEAWFERMTQYLGALPAPQLQGLRSQLSAGAALVVMTAEPLPDGVKRRWIEQLRTVLGETAQVSFAVDTALMAGAELRFPQARLEFSWQSVLQSLRQRLQPRETLESHAHAV